MLNKIFLETDGLVVGGNQLVASGGSISVANTSSTKLSYVPSTGILSATQFTATSDINQKNNIVVIQNALNIIENINGVTFNWKDTGLKSYGMIAQELEELLPELIETNPESGLKSVSYTQLIPFLIHAIKELTTRIKSLENK